MIRFIGLQRGLKVTGPGFTIIKSRNCLAIGECRGAKPLCRGLGGVPPPLKVPPRLGGYRGLKELLDDLKSHIWTNLVTENKIGKA